MKNITFFVFVNLQKVPPTTIPASVVNNVSSVVSQPPVALVPPTSVNNAATKSAVAPVVTPKSSISNDKPVIAPAPVEPSLLTAVVPAIINRVPVLEPPPIKKDAILPTVPNTYTTTLEQSLANLEQDILTNDVKNDDIQIESRSTSTDVTATPIPAILTNCVPNAVASNPNYLPSILQQQQQPPAEVKPPPSSMNMDSNSLMSTMDQDVSSFLPQGGGVTATASLIHSNNNGFTVKTHEFDMNSNNNSLAMSGTSMGARMQSMFDPHPFPVPKASISKEPMIHPKPIEELMDPIPGFIPGMNCIHKDLYKIKIIELRHS